MLSIRLQRNGRKKQAHYKVIVQDSRNSPTSGKVVAYLGNYNPHAKTMKLENEEAQRFLDNGAQPTKRVALLFKEAGIKLPSWVKIDDSKSKTTRNPEKLRKNQPKEEVAAAEEVTAEPAASEDTPTEPEVAAVEGEEKPNDAPTEEKTKDATEDSSADVETEKEDAPKEETSKEEPATEA